MGRNLDTPEGLYEEIFSILRNHLHNEREVNDVLCKLSKVNWNKCYETDQSWSTPFGNAAKEGCVICGGKLETAVTLRRLGIIMILCKRCVEEKNAKQEAHHLLLHLKRAIDVNIPGTLTLKQWMSTLDYFNWKCAYCQQEQYKVLEHFTPLSLQFGTTADNCVPACSLCNRKKHKLHPSQVKLIPSQDMERVRVYLNQFKEPLENCS